MPKVDFVNTLALQEKYIKAGMKGLKKVGEMVATGAKDYAPIKNGFIRMSIQVSESPEVDYYDEEGNQSKINLTDSDDENVIYISANTPYALKQHESVEFNHPNGGEDHYLEKPFDQIATNQRIQKEVAEEIGKVLK